MGRKLRTMAYAHACQIVDNIDNLTKDVASLIFWQPGVLLDALEEIARAAP